MLLPSSVCSCPPVRTRRRTLAPDRPSTRRMSAPSRISIPSASRGTARGDSRGWGVCPPQKNTSRPSGVPWVHEPRSRISRISPNRGQKCSLVIHFFSRLPHWWFGPRTKLLRCRAGLGAFDLRKPSGRPGRSEANGSATTGVISSVRRACRPGTGPRPFRRHAVLERAA
jgi:hypothetical protein